jgi:DtxR family transcriptional regulator, Mn-dependent transcriptional regulator
MSTDSEETTWPAIKSEALENYLKTIYELSASATEASAQEIAVRVGVSAPAVSKMLRHLAQHHLVDYTPYQPVTLTALGERVALEVIRHHRLLELYLMESLGYGWEQVHDEAERLEHHISEEFEASIERMLGFPAFDPHGDPIPTRDGKVPRTVTANLDSQPDGTEMVVRRVTDEDSALLLYLGDRGLRPGAYLHLMDREPFGGSLRVNVDGHEERVSPEAARNVFVEPVEVLLK